jgi:hypothetical protein
VQGVVRSREAAKFINFEIKYRSVSYFERYFIIHFYSPKAIGVWPFSSGERTKEKIQRILLILSNYLIRLESKPYSFIRFYIFDDY